jgi:hypothetical protein
MRLYWQGRISAVQAASAIGVTWRQVARQTPVEFNWKVANDAYAEKVIARRLAKIDRGSTE